MLQPEPKMDMRQRSSRASGDPGEHQDPRQARIDQLLEWQAWQQRLFDAIRTVNDESSSQRGAVFFDALTARLATVLGADVAFVGQLGLDGTSMDIVSVFGDGKRAQPFSYSLAGTPCAQVIANRVYAHSRDVVRLFPEDTLLAEMGIHAYVGVPLRDADGKSIGILVGLFRRDLDDVAFAESVLLFFAPRVALEIQQARSESVLRQRDGALHRLMDSNVVGFVVADLAGRILDANDAYLAMIGFDRDDLASGRIKWPEMAPPEDAADQPTTVERLLAQDSPKAWEAEWVRKDGTRVHVVLGGALMDASTGRVVAFVLDQTEHHRAERQRQEALVREHAALAEAQEANRAKDRFLAVVSHELRNPLSPITMAVGVLQTIAPADERMQNALRIIDRNVRHEARLVDDLLDMARVARGTLNIERKPLDLGRLLTEALSTMHEDARRAGLQLEGTFEPGLWVNADATRMSQVAINLLSNALKFTATGGRVAARLERDGDHARFSVEDSGVGIEPELLVRLFTPFVQGANGVSRRAGMGIGLSIVRSLVELHGGRAWAESQGQGQGARFIVELPTIARPQAETPVPAAPTGPRVLLVEDNDDAREMVATCLGMRGYSVAACASGEAALDWLGQERPGVILVDIGLPGIDGYQFLRGARLLAGCASIPALAVTALGQPEDMKRAREAGFAGHVVKPFDVDELAHRIRTLLVGERPADALPA
jgi:PAS domain S-box-containing protein